MNASALRRDLDQALAARGQSIEDAIASEGPSGLEQAAMPA